jgi:general secretion pathway protein G
MLVGFVLLTVNIEWTGSIHRAERAAAAAQIASFLDALGAYKRDTGRYPSNEEGLNALRVSPSGVTNWQGPYLPRPIPLDPWGREYVYKFPEAQGTKPDVISYGIK